MESGGIYYQYHLPWREGFNCSETTAVMMVKMTLLIDIFDGKREREGERERERWSNENAVVVDDK